MVRSMLPRMNCPKCNAPETAQEDQHGVRIVCMMCGFAVEQPGNSVSSVEAMRAKMEGAG